MSETLWTFGDVLKALLRVIAHKGILILSEMHFERLEDLLCLEVGFQIIFYLVLEYTCLHTLCSCWWKDACIRAYADAQKELEASQKVGKVKKLYKMKSIPKAKSARLAENESKYSIGRLHIWRYHMEQVCIWMSFSKNLYRRTSGTKISKVTEIFLTHRQQIFTAFGDMMFPLTSACNNQYIAHDSKVRRTEMHTIEFRLVDDLTIC